MPEYLPKSLSQAVLQTVAYSDIFEYPLTTSEVHRYLAGVRAPVDEVSIALQQHPFIKQTEEYFTLSSRGELVEERKAREVRSRLLMPHALRYGRILGSLPFVRMVALTGSLAVLNISKNADFDYMLVTAPGRVWTARAFSLLINKFARLFGHTLCPNLIISETALAWPLHDIYSARELYQMIPVTGLDVYQRLLAVNSWAGDLLPNAIAASLLVEAEQSKILKSVEVLLNGSLGERIENWEMTRKIERFSRQDGFGEETIFTAEVCQGNFHHHRKWTRDVFDNKLAELENGVMISTGELAA